MQKALAASDSLSSSTTAIKRLDSVEGVKKGEFSLLQMRTKGKEEEEKKSQAHDGKKRADGREKRPQRVVGWSRVCSLDVVLVLACWLLVFSLPYVRSVVLGCVS